MTAHTADTANTSYKHLFVLSQAELQRPRGWERDFKACYKLFVPAICNTKKLKKRVNNLLLMEVLLCLTAQELSLLWAQFSLSLFHLDLTQIESMHGNKTYTKGADTQTNNFSWKHYIHHLCNVNFVKNSVNNLSVNTGTYNIPKYQGCLWTHSILGYYVMQPRPFYLRVSILSETLSCIVITHFCRFIL